MCLQYKSLENTVGNEKLLVTSNFSFSLSVFYPLRELSAIFIEFEIVVCKLFQFEAVQNVSFGKELTNKKEQFIYLVVKKLEWHK